MPGKTKVKKTPEQQLVAAGKVWSAKIIKELEEMHKTLKRIEEIQDNIWNERQPG